MKSKQSDLDKILLYIYWDKRDLTRCKIGDTHSKIGENPNEIVSEYIRTKALGRDRKGWNDRFIEFEFWDMTEYAKKYNLFYKHSKIDDKIRPAIGHREGTSGDWHTMHPDDAIIAINEIIDVEYIEKPKVKLSSHQAWNVKNISNMVSSGHRTIMAEFCARFGKTIYAGALIRELNPDITIIGSYVQSVFTSFKKELGKFSQFRNLVLIDSKDKDYQIKIEDALKSRKQIVVFLSSVVGRKRQERIEFLFGLPQNRLFLLDEADYGAHKLNQVEPILNARGSNDVFILMTGTNADRASNYWPIDGMLSVVYPELIMEKKAPKKTYLSGLKYFEIDSTRHDYYVDAQYYQADVSRVVNLAMKLDSELFAENGINLPSWSKFSVNVTRAKGFWCKLLETLFLGKNSIDELNMDYQFDTNVADGNRHAMMFLSGGMKKIELEKAEKYAAQALPGYIVKAVCGNNTTNAKAEKMINDIIDDAEKSGKSVLILSSKMAQRSFSVGRIDELYLAYDNGDSGATEQKMSRVLTPNKVGKIGRIISLSFDPNRDSKFDQLFMSAALNYQKSHRIASFKDAIRSVIGTVDIFSCAENGPLKFHIDSYLEKLHLNNSIAKVLGAISDVNLLTDDKLLQLVNSVVSKQNLGKVEISKKGETYSEKRSKTGNIGKSSVTVRDKLLIEAREKIVALGEDLNILFSATNTTSITNAIHVVKNKKMEDDFIELFGLNFSLFEELIAMGVLNTSIIELSYRN